MEMNLDPIYKLTSVDISDGTTLNSNDFDQLTLKGNDLNLLYIKSSDNSNLNDLNKYFTYNWFRYIFTGRNIPMEKATIARDITFSYEKTDHPEIRKKVILKNAFPENVSEHHRDISEDEVDDITVTFKYDTKTVIIDFASLS